jgi:hypothetical protein
MFYLQNDLLHNAVTQRVNLCISLTNGEPHPERINFEVMQSMSKIHQNISALKYYKLFITSWQAVSNIFNLINIFQYLFIYYYYYYFFTYRGLFSQSTCCCTTGN